MKKLTIFIFLCLPFLHTSKSKADMFGGDTAVLIEILANALEQLTQLYQIVQAGQDTLSLIEDINQGINDSMRLAQVISPHIDPGIFHNWETPDQALRNLQSVYGVVSSTRNQSQERHNDLLAAEAISRSIALFEIAKNNDQIGREIDRQSHLVSPGGAQKLTAQGIGLLLNASDESLRTQATSLKLQAHAMAVENHHEKERSKHIEETTQNLKTSMRSRRINLNTPRF